MPMSEKVDDDTKFGIAHSEAHFLRQFGPSRTVRVHGLLALVTMRVLLAATALNHLLLSPTLCTS